MPKSNVYLVNSKKLFLRISLLGLIKKSFNILSIKEVGFFSW